MMRDWTSEARQARLDHWADRSRPASPMSVELRGALNAAMITMQGNSPAIFATTFATSPDLAPLLIEACRRALEEDYELRRHTRS